MATTGTTPGASLSRGAIGLREVLFQSVTSMAPAGAVALSIAAGATYAGGALPLAVLLALVACLLVASSIGQLAKHLPSARKHLHLSRRGHPPGARVPGRLGLRAGRGAARADHHDPDRLPGGIDHE